MSYSKFQADVSNALKVQFADCTIRQIMKIVDDVARNYSVNQTTHTYTGICNDVPPEVDSYLSARKLEGISIESFKHKHLLLKNFFAQTNKQLQEIVSDDIRHFLITYQQERKVSNRTLEGYRVVINACFSWLLDNGYVSRNVCKSIRPIKYETPQHTSLSRYELEELRSLCKSTRETALVEFMYSTGCRISEIVNAKLKDINWKDRSLVVLGKGNKYRTVFLSARCLISLNQYLNALPYTPTYVFEHSVAPYGKMTTGGLRKSFCNIVKRMKSNTKNITPHTMRHTMATQALDSGMPIEQVQKLLGHASIDTTEIYAEVFDSAVKRMHERCIV